MSATTYDIATVNVLWRRDLLRLWRHPSRVLGAVGQPLIFWLVLGIGMATTFSIPGVELGYLEFFFPGVILMAALFAAVFATASVIEDRRQGFLQAVLAGPGSRAAFVVGKCLGSASVAFVQLAPFVLLAPLAGFAWTEVSWPLLLLALAASCIALSAVGFVAAWLLDDLRAYHAILIMFLMPLWAISGAMFPPHPGGAVLGWLMRLNPATYAVAAVRHGLYGGSAPAGTVAGAAPWISLGVVTLFGLICILAAVVVCRRH